MNKPRPCGCKGCRTCLICETKYGLQEKNLKQSLDREKSYVYCPQCNAAWSGWDVSFVVQQHPNHTGTEIAFPGVYIEMDFIREDEEVQLMMGIDEMPWDGSQSGRRKQNFGPKTNFKKKKLAVGSFAGFPAFSRFIQERFENVGILKNYKTIEQCSLEYTEEKGASIDPHIDDCWIWGERIVTVNCLTDSVLTLTPFNGDTKKYNLNEAENYGPVIKSNGSLNIDFETAEESAYIQSLPKEKNNVVVRVPMPRRSLLVIYGAARYHWEHAVLREDISGRRVCIAYREFTPPYLKNGVHEDKGETVLSRAKLFWDHREHYRNINIESTPPTRGEGKFPAEVRGVKFIVRSSGERWYCRQTGHQPVYIFYWIVKF